MESGWTSWNCLTSLSVWSVSEDAALRAIGKEGGMARRLRRLDGQEGKKNVGKGTSGAVCIE